jgi:hypothetical protein
MIFERNARLRKSARAPLAAFQFAEKAGQDGRAEPVDIVVLRRSWDSAIDTWIDAWSAYAIGSFGDRRQGADLPPSYSCKQHKDAPTARSAAFPSSGRDHPFHGGTSHPTASICRGHDCARILIDRELPSERKWPLDPDAIERAVAYQDGNAIRAVYNRTAYWNERIEMMQWWSDELDSIRRMPPGERCRSSRLQGAAREKENLGNAPCKHYHPRVLCCFRLFYVTFKHAPVDPAHTAGHAPLVKNRPCFPLKRGV